MRSLWPILIFLTAAAILGIPVGVGVASGWLCDRYALKDHIGSE